ncbi:MAG: D-alanyl-D-alanine carboxypeptidase family protein [Burkholderiaceae bacterium]
MTAAFALLAFVGAAHAQSQSPAPAAAPAPSQAVGPTLAARSWLLVDVTTGQALAWYEPDTKVEPASLTKLMTAYVVFGALRDKRLQLDMRPPVSQLAYKAIGSRMFVDPAKPATVEELINGMIVQSGNDASIILAEAVAGSEDTFAQAMNREAQRMGMTNTSFRNSTGLPDLQHYSTARDMAILGSRLIQDFPEQYATYYSKKDYTYNGIKQPNRNRLLFIDPTVDGMKTGHTEAAGFCLVASSRREQPGAGFSRRLLAVVLGTGSESSRAIETQKLLNYGFQNFDAVKVFGKGQPAGEYEVWKGKTAQVKAGFDQDVLVTVPKGQADKLKAEIERVKPLVAPLTSGQRIGTLRVKLDDRVLVERPLLALDPVDEAGLFGRLWDTMRMWISSK